MMHPIAKFRILDFAVARHVYLVHQLNNLSLRAGFHVIREGLLNGPNFFAEENGD